MYPTCKKINVEEQMKYLPQCIDDARFASIRITDETN